MAFIEEIPLHETARTRYLAYALSVITSRALPDLRDGLKPVQRRILYAMHTMLRLMPDGRFRKSATVVGECFVAGTRVSTPGGWQAIETLEVGDAVHTQSGVRRVTERYVMPPQPLRRIALQGGRHLTCTPGQAFKVLRPDLTLGWKDARDLVPGDAVVARAAHPQGTRGGDELDADLAYLLGFFLADGWLDRDAKSGRVRLAFACADRPVIERVQAILLRRLGAECTVQTRGTMFWLRLNDSALSAAFVERFGLRDKYAPAIRIPEALWTASPESLFAFVSGFADGDGSVHATRRLLVLTSVAEPFLRGLQTLLHGQGIASRLLPYRKSAQAAHHYTEWALEIGGRSLHRLAPHLTLSAPRKRDRLAAWTDGPARFAVEDADRIPHLGALLVETFRQRHLGGGWYATPDGAKVRSGLEYPGGAKLRYAADLADTLDLSFASLHTLGFLAKMDALGMPLADTLRTWEAQGVGFLRVTANDAADADITYDIQVEGEHEFIAEGVVVHNCMGKLHPHGDTAIYDAMVRMAQDFSLRAPLVDGQGNFGSLDGDNAAAMRYTEAKLRPLAVELIDELKKQTVAWRPNYDGTLSEPVVLPARYPNLLVNGAVGIAVGMATNIPPHNLGEVVDACLLLIQKPNASLDDVLAVLPAPDFPTGGRLLATADDLRQMYATGEGSFELRGEYVLEGAKQIVLTSVPYGLSKSDLIEKIAEHIVAEKVPQLVDVRDESTEDVRVVLELRKGASAEAAMAYLFKQTPLQTRFHTNLTCLVPTDNPEVAAPQRLGLLPLLHGFLSFRMETLVRRTRFDLDGLNRRIHLLEGFERIFPVLDEVIRIIRASADKGDAAQRLMHRFGLDDEQVDAILELKLYRLARLEIEVIQKELAEKRALADGLQRLLDDEKARWKAISAEMKDLRKRFADARRTTVALPEAARTFSAEDYIVAEDVHVVVTRDGWVKRQRSFTEVGAIRVREGDRVGWVVQTSTRCGVCFLTSAGKAYTLRADQLPQTTGYGDPVQKYFDFADRETIVGVVAYDPRILPEATVSALAGDEMLFGGNPGGDGGANGAPSAPEGPFVVAVSSGGNVVRLPAEVFSDPSNKNGRTFMRLAAASDAVVMADVASGSETVCVAARSSHVLLFPVTQVPVVRSAAKGVIAIRLDKNDAVLGATLATGKRDGLEVETGRGRREIVRATKFAVTARGGKGKAVLTRGGFASVVPEVVVRRVGDT